MPQALFSSTDITRIETGRLSAGFITKGSQDLNRQLTNLDQQFYARLSATLAELDTCIQAMVRGNRSKL